MAEFKISISSCTKHRKIPPAFSLSLRKPLPDRVFFRNPRLRRWVVDVRRVGREWHFWDGWEKFVQDNKKYVQSDRNTFVFKFDGVDIFDVKRFDPSKPGSNVVPNEPSVAYPSKPIDPLGHDIFRAGLATRPDPSIIRGFFVTKVKKQKELCIPKIVTRNWSSQWNHTSSIQKDDDGELSFENGRMAVLCIVEDGIAYVEGIPFLKRIGASVSFIRPKNQRTDTRSVFVSFVEM